MFNILYLIMFDMLPYLLNVTFSFTNYPMGLRYNQKAKTCFHGNILKQVWTFKTWYVSVKHKL